jgi:hypothetical protein
VLSVSTRQVTSHCSLEWKHGASATLSITVESRVGATIRLHYPRVASTRIQCSNLPPGPCPVCKVTSAAQLTLLHSRWLKGVGKET